MTNYTRTLYKCAAPLLVLLAVSSPGRAQETAIETISIVHQQAYRGSIPATDLPQSVESFDMDQLDVLGITRFQEVLDMSGTIARQNNGGGLWDSFSIRGFPGNENMPSGYLINGFNGGRGFSGHRDVSNIQSIDILKGPGSALYGRSEPGGTINITTKKPAFEEQGYIKGSAAEFQQYRLEGDYTNGFTDNIAFRVNGAWQDHGSFRDYVTSDKKVITPSVSWQINDVSSVLYEFEYLQQEQLFDRGVVVLDNNFATLPVSRYLGNPDDAPTRIQSTGHYLAYQQQLDHQWSLLAGYNYRRSTLNGFSSDAELAASRQSLYDDGQTLTRQHRQRDYATDDHSVRIELSGDIQLAGITHRLMVGADAYDYQISTDLYRFRGEAGSYALDIYDPQYNQSGPPVSLLYANTEAQQAWGVYIQDQLVVTPKLKILAGVRFDRYEQNIAEALSAQTNTADDARLSPRLGLTYSFTRDLTLYASYSEGFLPLSGTDAQGQSFDPEESHSAEVGARYSWDKGSMNVVVFDATKSNILTSDPINVGFSAPLGEAVSRGIEIDGDVAIAENTQLRFSYAFMDTKTANEAVNPDWGVLVSSGADLVNVPRHNAALQLTQFARMADQDWQFGTGIHYVDDRLGDTVTPSYRLPSYTLVNLYAQVALTPAWLLRVNIDNALNETYYTSSYSALWTVPGEPQKLSVSAKYQF